MNATVQFQSESEAETMELASSLAGHLAAGDVVALEGPLGSGKTCFVRGLAIGLGLDPASVSSPTFVISQEYADPDPSRPLSKDAEALVPLVHVDAYRLNGVDELESIGWNEMLDSKDAVIAIEWPSRIQPALPTQRIDVALTPAGEHVRHIQIRASSELASALKNGRHSSKGAATADVVCRTCGRRIDRAVATFPFCSARCRMSDLGKWFNESYRVSREVEADEELTE